MSERLVLLLGAGAAVAVGFVDAQLEVAAVIRDGQPRRLVGERFTRTLHLASSVLHREARTAVHGRAVPQTGEVFESFARVRRRIRRIWLHHIGEAVLALLAERGAHPGGVVGLGLLAQGAQLFVRHHGRVVVRRVVVGAVGLARGRRVRLAGVGVLLAACDEGEDGGEDGDDVAEPGHGVPPLLVSGSVELPYRKPCRTTQPGCRSPAAAGRRYVLTL